MSPSYRSRTTTQRRPGGDAAGTLILQILRLSLLATGAAMICALCAILWRSLGG